MLKLIAAGRRSSRIAAVLLLSGCLTVIGASSPAAFADTAPAPRATDTAAAGDVNAWE
ncbi:hypothetical protein [Streptomyces sp. NBC_01423]|uniref:hypothetical protein n=1 Tax=Streptomyces sp. NBC_01423 TaxID=2903860 RepID=UPI002E296D04|nr:hypothetical protein [Streptomyces sp. NBC_01423]